jgi:arylsulfatase A-like enzyme
MNFYCSNLKVTAMIIFLALTLPLELSAQSKTEETLSEKPNIIIFYVDDLGYGDIGINGAKNVTTPNIDQLAAEGINFTDAHSTAATCTPSRYALLTGEHGFRINSDILEGDAPALIKPGKPTLPIMLKKQGYKSAVIGKWHLGFGDGNINWNNKVSSGPLEIGFDYSFLMPITGDRVPSVFLENHHVVNLEKNDPIAVNYSKKIGNRPHGDERPDLVRYAADEQHNDTIINGVPRIGSMSGGERALWNDEEIPTVFNNKAIEFIRSNSDNPFFLFYSFHDIHVPRLPHQDFSGSTNMGPRGDAIAQVDWVVGEIIKEIETLGINKNTLVIFTSDNGPVINDGYEDGADQLLNGHNPAGVYRGGKYGAYEAGTRMPTILRWNNKIIPGTSSALLSQVDFYASFADLLGINLQENEAIDSMNMLSAFMGRSEQGRDYIIEESVATLSLRMGQWKYISPSTEEAQNRNQWVKSDKDIEGGFSLEEQLYNLEDDASEMRNIAKENPEITQKMRKKIQELRHKGFRE